MNARTLLSALVAASLPAALVACSCSREPERGASTEEVLLRDRAAAHFRNEEFQAARRELEPLLQRDPPAVEDLIRAANVELALGLNDAARPLVERARELTDDDPAVHWALYRLARDDGEFDAALEHVRAAHELVPGDYPTHLALANMLAELERYDEAEAEYRELLGSGVEHGGSWYVSLVYRYGRMLQQTGRDDEAAERLQEFNELTQAGYTVPETNDLSRGTFGDLSASPPGPTTPPAPRPLAALVSPADEPLGGLAGLRLKAVTLESSPWDVGTEGYVFPSVHRPPALVAWGAGLYVVERDGVGWTRRELTREPVSAVVGIVTRQGRDPRSPAAARAGTLDLVAAVTGGLVLLEQQPDGSFERRQEPLYAFDGLASDLLAVDVDHEGDLDLVAVGDFGVRLLRNDGFGDPGGTFTDVTAESGLPADAPFAWCLAEDLDADSDVDLLLGGRRGGGPPLHATNERGGRFALVPLRLPAHVGAEGAPPPVVADLNGDYVPDLIVPGPGGSAARVFHAVPGGASWRETAAAAGPTTDEAWRTATRADVDSDGATDLAWAADGAVGVLLAAGSGGGVGGALEPLVTGHAVDPTPGRLVLADFDGRGAEDVAHVDGAGELRLYPREDRGNGLLLALRGVKDNWRGVGAIVEVRAGGAYRRIFWDGEPRWIGVGERDQADVVRITWPNGVVQNVLGLPAGGGHVVKQREGLIGSCPFLYAWNGETYGFVSDVLGITPLGLPMGPGALVPPDHDEYVLVRGDQLAPEDGVYELQLTEELREVTYLDRIRLDVVDHPAGTEVQPNERFTFPPFPEHHTHTITGALAPRAARGSDARDWTGALAAVDDDFALHFEPLVGQLQGLAEPHWLELEFDPERVRDASKLRLVMTGWFFWTDASVNMAAARHAGVDFVPPLLLVPDGKGGWRENGPPLGFPAGKLKTMVVDVTGRVDRDDPRVRIFSTLRLYWDSIRLAVDDDDAPLRVTSLEPTSARLWSRGFSRPIPVHGQRDLEWFEWDQLEDEPRWNQHPGLYTRLGETLPLVTAIDDMFVILGAGDALTVRFDATLAPPLPEGWTRDFLVFLDGWAKDRDPNTREALFVEPLPFHGMSAYPYGPDETFPRTEAHRRWRLEWNTRPAKRWLEPLAPAAPGAPRAALGAAAR